MGTTTNYQYPYPEQSDPVDVAGDVKRLADAIDANLKATIDKAVGGVQSGSVQVTWNNSASAGVNVVFPRPYKAPPNVVTTLGNEYRNAAAASITTTGFDFRGRTNSDQPTTGSSGGWWIAHGELA